jgi:uncharacterized protein YndB with AHSA1/START domain
MSTPELSRIDRTSEIQASPERVWKSLTDARELSAWFQVTVEGEIVPGNDLWMTSVMEGYKGIRFQVHIVEMTPPRRFVWQWHPGAVDPKVDYSREPRTTVTFTLEAAGKGTRLTVTETGFEKVSLARRAKVYDDNSQGWTEVIVWIKNHVEQGR